MYKVLVQLMAISLEIIKTIFKSNTNLIIENLALRQQLANYKAKKTKPRLTDLDRSFWIALKQTWCNWKDFLVIVNPETVIDWQNRRFKKHWTRLSTKNKRPGRKRLRKEIRDLLFRIAGENYWGAPRI